jgi:aldose 1-epimerase
VTNIGDFALPFGLGHHLFLPLTEAATLLAPATAFWTEKHDYLPGECTAIPSEVDFSTAHGLPARWINNGFEGWDGRATVRWPELGLALEIEAEPPFDRYFLFRSDLKFEPGFRADYFCFEPMTHAANGHNLPSGGGLKRLARGETLATHLRLRPTRTENLP